MAWYWWILSGAGYLGIASFAGSIIWSYLKRANTSDDDAGPITFFGGLFWPACVVIAVICYIVAFGAWLGSKCVSESEESTSEEPEPASKKVKAENKKLKEENKKLLDEIAVLETRIPGARRIET